MDDDYRRTKIGPTAEPEPQHIQPTEGGALAPRAAPLAKVAWVLRQPLLWIGFAIGAVVVALVALWLWLRTRKPPQEPLPEPAALPPCSPLGLLGGPTTVPTA